MRPLSFNLAFKNRCRQIVVQATHQIEKIVLPKWTGVSIPTEPKAVPELTPSLFFVAVTLYFLS